jgi:RNA polymerase sigma-70 factor (ECF subfamily)
MAVFPFLTARARPEPVEGFEPAALAEADALYRTALRLTRQPAAAEDLVQETYLKAFRASARFAAGTNLRAWLFTILMNTFRNARRDGAKDVVAVDSEIVDRAGEDAKDAVTPEQLLLKATLDTDLQTALDALPPAFREAVWLRDVEEFSYAEIARMLDVPPGTVMSRISRGRRLLYDRLSGTRSDQGRRATTEPPIVAGPAR